MRQVIFLGLRADESRSVKTNSVSSLIVWDECTRNERLVLLALRGGPLSLFSEETRERAGLPAATFVQRAVKGLLRDDTLEQLSDRRYRLAEPFLAEWLDRDRSTRMEHGA